MLHEVKGLVLRTTDVGDSDRMLTIYSDDMGLISARARHSRSLKSRLMPSTMQFCYSSFVIFEQGDKCTVKEASVIESFYGLRSSIETLALGAYMLDVLAEVGTAEPEQDLLRLVLNSLYAISNGKGELSKIKAAFEIRIAAILGYMPDVLACHECGEREGDFYLDVMAGAALCRECYRRSERNDAPLSDPHESHIVYILSPAARTALGYCIYAPLERLFSFNIPPEDMHLFARATESYLLNQLERGFKTLDFYNEVKR